MSVETVLITGASSGIGRELARCFAADGCRLILVARKRQALQALADELNEAHKTQSEVFPADLSQPGTPARIFELFQVNGTKVDVLINNAGFGAVGDFAELAVERQLEMVQVNVTAVTHLTRLLLPGMIERHRGGILNVASTAGFAPGPGMGVYYATKAFLLSFSEAVAEELAGTGVTVTALCPGPTETNFAEAANARTSRLFAKAAMSAESVAWIGHDAFRKGRVVAIAGFRNRLLAFSVRLAPRFVVRKIAKRLVVTSQEDIDAVLGEMKRGAANDFSKIQGRFKTRLSLSSANVDEVIQERLLAKRDEVMGSLEKLHATKGDILKNQLSFTNVGPTLKSFKDADDFVRNYPFAPYQFQLVQKVFEAIRKAGATGLHLSRGERSILDAFQSAAKQIAGDAVSVLVPFWRFYPSIESFLDTSVKRTIDQAETNASLEPFDIKLLQVLFLIRYVEEIKGNINNLVTLCIDEIDADRLALRERIQESLQRLEKETLINRSGDNYFFLTNEERDISREIKSVDLSSGEEAKLLGELIFDEVLKGNRKHRYTINEKDFQFNCLCDLHPVGRRVENGLVVSVVSPLADDYKLCDNARCILASTSEGGQILLRLNDDESLGRELRTYKKTQKYVLQKNDGSLPESTKRILRGCAEDNRLRRESLVILLSTLLLEAAYYAAGSKLTLKAEDAASAMNQALDYLIQNTFPKMGLLKRLNTDPQREIQAVLRSNDIAQQTLAAQTEAANPQALDEVRGYVDLCTRASRTIVLHEMIESRYGIRPYGWPDWEVILLVARLAVLGEIQVVMNGAVVAAEKIYGEISAPAKWRKITIVQRRNVDTKLLQTIRALGKEVFAEMGPESEEGLFTFLTGKLKKWGSELQCYRPLADTGSYSK